MSFEIDTALVNTYQRNIEVQFQQKGSRLRKTVMVAPQNAEYEFYDRIESVEAEEFTTRFGDTPITGTPFDRRRVGMRDFGRGDFIDRKDQIRMLADPTSPMTMNMVYAMGRKLDKIIIEEARATAYAGKTGATSVSYPSTSEVAANFVESGSATASNLTVGKLRQARYLLNEAEAVEDGEELFAVVTASQIQALLRITEVTSSDYAAVKALVHGEVDSYMGFTFVRTQLVEKVGNIRNCLFYPRSAIQVGMGREFEVDIGPRRDKRNAKQIFVTGSAGAVRMWEEKVITVKCDES